METVKRSLLARGYRGKREEEVDRRGIFNESTLIL